MVELTWLSYMRGGFTPIPAYGQQLGVVESSYRYVKGSIACCKSAQHWLGPAQPAEHSTAQHSTAQRSTAEHSTAQQDATRQSEQDRAGKVRPV